MRHQPAGSQLLPGLTPLLLVLAGCPLGERAPGPDAGDSTAVEQCGVYEIPAGRIDPNQPWPGLSCADYPQLCHLPVDSTVKEPDRTRAIDIAFVGDGFTAAELPEYRAFVSQLIAGVVEPADGFVARRPSLFNFHRVDAVSDGSSCSDAERADTALAGCVDIDATGNLVVEDRLAGLAGTANVEGVDVVVVVLNTRVGSPNSSPGPAPGRPAIVRVNRLVDGVTVLHELGHAIFHLGDEYGTQPACFTPPDLPAFTTADYLYDVANLSTEDTGAKWAGTAVAGAAPGGMDFRYCVFHPGPECLMNGGSLPFCPVCSRAVDATLDAREGRPDGPPVCGIELADHEPGYVQGTVEARVVLFDRNYPSSWSLRLDGALIAAGEVPFWYQRTAAAFDASSLSEGTHTLSAECRDAQGATASAQVELTVRH